MDLRRLKTFVAVADLGTVTKAAVHLRVGQPALSRQISDLQQELGLRLFDRVGRRLILTAQGEQLLVDCRRVLTDLNRVRERADVHTAQKSQEEIDRELDKSLEDSFPSSDPPAISQPTSPPSL
jgi:DNA-binding transcriptional LysR family regulator